MFEKKPWYKSRAVWASAASLLIAILTAIYGEGDTIVSMAIAILSALGIYGRVAAKSELTR